MDVGAFLIRLSQISSFFYCYHLDKEEIYKSSNAMSQLHYGDYR